MAIHPSAQIHPSAVIHDNVEIGPGVVVGREAEIGEGCVLMSGAVISDYSKLGTGNMIHYHVVIGDDPQFLGFDRRIRSRVRIGNNNVIRESATINRAIHEGAETVVGDNCFLMAYSHLAHDCQVGNNVIMANSAAIAGHCIIEDRAFVSGLVAVHQWCRIGRLAMLGGQSGIGKDVPPFLTTKQGGSSGWLMGVNILGMRRAGIGPEARLAVKTAFREMFRSGHSLPRAIAAVRERWQGRAMPAELEQIVAFCEAKSRRGILMGRKPVHTASADDGDDEA